jgi:hypothetical protein
MHPILQTAADFLKSKRFHYSITDDGEALCLPCVGEKLVWSTLVTTDKEGSMVTLLSRVPVRVPAVTRGACATLLARLNYGRRLGAFHMDFRDGEVLFCLTHIVADQKLTDAVIDALMGTTYGAMDGSATEVIKLVYVRSRLAKAKSKGSGLPPGNQRLEFN